MQADIMNEFDPQSHLGAMPSPCISVCKMNARSGLCEGCLRTIDEIAQWSTATEDFKRMAWMQIKQRQAQIK